MGKWMNKKIQNQHRNIQSKKEKWELNLCTATSKNIWRQTKSSKSPNTMLGRLCFLLFEFVIMIIRNNDSSSTEIDYTHHSSLTFIHMSYDLPHTSYENWCINIYKVFRYTCSPTTLRTGTRLTWTKQKFPGPKTINIK